jgi:hypothetical protein
MDAGRLWNQEVAIKRMVRRGFRHSSEAQLFINETSVFWFVQMTFSSRHATGRRPVHRSHA